MIKIIKIKELILYFFIFIPFLPSFIKHTYTAPYAIIVSSIILLIIKRKFFPRELFFLFLLFFLSLILLSNGFNFNTLRIVSGYFSIFIIATGTFIVCKLNNRVNLKLIYIFFIIWFLIGLIQYFINPEFMTSLVVRSKTTYDRGVGSLAPEPSYYASVMLFFIIISYLNDYKFKLTLVLGVISIIFISTSATGLFVLLGFSLIYFSMFIINKNTFRIFFLVFTFGVIIYLNFDILSGNRIHKIVYSFINDPESIFVKDASANARIWHIIGSFSGAFENYLLPNPINNFEEKTLNLISKNLEYVHPYTIETLNNKPMSGTGQILFNLGFIGLLYFYILFRLSFKCFRSQIKALFVTLCMFLFMTTAIPLSFPIFGFIYGLLTYRAYKDSYENLSSIRKS